MPLAYVGGAVATLRPLYYGTQTNQAMQTENFIPEITTKKEPAETDLFFIFFGKEMLVQDRGGTLHVPTRADLAGLIESLEVEIFIGSLGATSCYTAIAKTDSVPSGYHFSQLRPIFFNCKEEYRSPLSTAVLVKDWAVNTRYCGRCGAKTEPRENEWCASCPQCGYVAYPRMSPAVIVAVLKEGKILLAHNRRFPSSQMYSLIAGFVEPGESLEGTVHREILEETGLTVKNIRYFSSQCWPFPDSLMVGFVAEYASGELTLEDELEDAGWFSKDTMPKVPDKGPISRKIIDWYLDTGGDVSLL